jgi:ribonuclease HI
MKQVTLATDGACSGNPGPGGWAALLRFHAHEKLISGGERATTNNRMEIMAVLEGLRVLKERCRVTIYSDSRYVIDAFEKRWLQGWRRNGWTTKSKQPVKNRELWEQLAVAVEAHEVTWVWVRGHAGHADNERVDAAARAATGRQR